ncbi:L-serine ammonia-lyase [Ramicandelaber brevisporus]|nr:L-serine ammonia-lyase [Ramicandelaber brevisporus]
MSAIQIPNRPQQLQSQNRPTRVTSAFTPATIRRLSTSSTSTQDNHSSTAEAASSSAQSASDPDTASATETSHAVVSTFDLFSIGIGPSSSHTVGPMRAAKIFIDDLVHANILDRVHTIRVDLYGSLALTGHGHGTPGAILMGLEGETPETVETTTIQPRLSAMQTTSSISLNSTHRVPFSPLKDVVFHRFETLPQHPNGMRFTVLDSNADLLATNEYFSIGGGFVVNEKTQLAHGENVFYKTQHDVEVSDVRECQDLIDAALPFHNSAELLQVCQRTGMTIAQVVYENELQWRTREQVREKVHAIWQTMDMSIRNGCLAGDGELLPGSLRVRRRAPGLYKKLMRGMFGGGSVSAAGTSPPYTSRNANLLQMLSPRRHQRRLVLPALDYLSVYAIAVNEENAAGGRVVTAPTNGAAGVIPAVLKYYLEFISDDPERDIFEFLFTAAAVGMLYKRGASISAAEMGCQGEVGVACSMAAAAFTAVMGGSPAQVENAAEIGIEHNLGLTCDPVDGLVQIPCIERNALGAVKAVTAAQLALNGDGMHRVSLDNAIETMRQTGLDMQSKYKETSLGGLAVNVPVC